MIYKTSAFAKIFIIIYFMFILQGCLAQQQLKFMHGDIEITADRRGCNIYNVLVANYGSQARTISGKIDAINSSNFTILSANYTCPTVYAGGRARCNAYFLQGHGNIFEAGGPGCPDFAKFISNPTIF